MSCKGKRKIKSLTALPQSIWKQHKANGSLVSGPAFNPPHTHADWIVLNLIWDLSIIWISSLVGHHSDKPLIWGTGAQRHDSIMLKMRNLMRVDGSLCKWSEGAFLGSSWVWECRTWTDWGIRLSWANTQPLRHPRGRPFGRQQWFSISEQGPGNIRQWPRLKLIIIQGDDFRGGSISDQRGNFLVRVRCVLVSLEHKQKLEPAIACISTLLVQYLQCSKTLPLAPWCCNHFLAFLHLRF